MQNSILYRDFEDVFHANIDFNIMNNSSVLITGATGLIGSLITKFLLYINQKYNLNIDIFAVARNKEKATEVFFDEINDKHLRLVFADLLKDECNFSFHADYVIHAASVTASRYMVSYPIETIFTSINGLQKMLDYSIENDVKSFVYLSSMEVYGLMNESNKIKEDKLGYIDLSSARSSYPESKRMCECICTAYAIEHNLNVKSARLAQTFGAGISKTENRVFAQFAKSAMNHKDIILHTEGNSEGNYIYTTDAILGIFTILLFGASGESYNVSNEKNHLKISELASFVARVLGNNQCKVIYDIPKDANKYGYAPDTKLYLDTSKLLSLGWKPKVNLEQSFRRMAIWIREMEKNI